VKKIYTAKLQFIIIMHQVEDFNCCNEKPAGNPYRVIKRNNQ